MVSALRAVSPRRQMQVDHAEGERNGPDVFEARLSEQRRQGGRREKGLHRCGQVGVGLRVPGDEATDPRQGPREVPPIEPANGGRRWHTELQNREPAARPQDPMDLATGLQRVVDISDAESDGHGLRRRVGQRDLRRVAAHQPDGRPGGMLVKLRSPEAQHRAGEVDADDAAGASTRLADGGKRQVARAGAEVHDRFPATQRERVDGPSPPTPIESGAQESIERVVAGCDRVEHARDAAGVLPQRRRVVRHPFQGG